MPDYAPVTNWWEYYFLPAQLELVNNGGLHMALTENFRSGMLAGFGAIAGTIGDEFVAVRGEITDLQTTVSTLTGANADEINAALAQIQTNADAANTLIANLQTTVATLDGEDDSIIAQINTAVADLNAARQSVETDLQAAIDAAAASDDVRFSAIEAAATSLAARVSDTEGGIVALQSALGALTGRVSAIEADLADFTANASIVGGEAATHFDAEFATALAG